MIEKIHKSGIFYNAEFGIKITKANNNPLATKNLYFNEIKLL